MLSIHRLRKPGRAASLTFLGILAAGTSIAAPVTVYDAIPSQRQSELARLGIGMYAVEWGDKLTLASGPRVLKKVDVLLNSSACQYGSSAYDCVTTAGATFSHPITLDVYSIDSGGALTQIGSVTQTFANPFRPSTDAVNCPEASSDPNKWWDGTACWTAKAFLVTFDSAALSAITLPDTFVFGVTWNTQYGGYHPIHQSGPYNGLSLATGSGAPVVGTDATGSGTYYNYAYRYCDQGAGGTFRPETCTWYNGAIAIRFLTRTPGIEVNVAGFGSPVDPAPTLNKAKAGQTIPLKFYVADEGGQAITNLSAVDVTMAPVNCGSLEATGVDPIEVYSTGERGLVNLGGGYYQWNWKTTKGATGCSVVSLSLPEDYSPTPEALEAYFQFAK